MIPLKYVSFENSRQNRISEEQSFPQNASFDYLHKINDRFLKVMASLSQHEKEINQRTLKDTHNQKISGNEREMHAIGFQIYFLNERINIIEDTLYNIEKEEKSNNGSNIESIGLKKTLIALKKQREVFVNKKNNLQEKIRKNKCYESSLLKCMQRWPTIERRILEELIALHINVRCLSERSEEKKPIEVRLYYIEKKLEETKKLIEKIEAIPDLHSENQKNEKMNFLSSMLHVEQTIKSEKKEIKNLFKREMISQSYLSNERTERDEEESTGYSGIAEQPSTSHSRIGQEKEKHQKCLDKEGLFSLKPILKKGKRKKQEKKDHSIFFSLMEKKIEIEEQIIKSNNTLESIFLEQKLHKRGRKELYLESRYRRIELVNKRIQELIKKKENYFKNSNTERSMIEKKELSKSPEIVRKILNFADKKYPKLDDSVILKVMMPNWFRLKKINKKIKKLDNSEESLKTKMFYNIKRQVRLRRSNEEMQKMSYLKSISSILEIESYLSINKLSRYLKKEERRSITQERLIKNKIISKLREKEKINH